MKRTILAAMIFAAASAGPALAQMGVPGLPKAGAISVTPDAGTAITVGGEFVNSGSQSFTGSTSLFNGPAAPSITVTGTATLTVPSRSFADVYDTPIQLGASVNYGLSDHDEISGRFRWLHADADTFNAMNVSASVTVNNHTVGASTSLQGKFSNYDEEGLELDYRHFFDTSWAGFHPYVGALVGAKYNDAISLNLLYQGTTIASGIHFYGSGISLSSGLSAGFRYDVASNVALGLETGIRYEGTLDRDNSSLSGSGGLSGINSGGDRWDIPILAGATIRF